MSSVTSLPKGGSKFAPKAKPRPTRRSQAAATQGNSEVRAPTEENEVQKTLREHEHTRQTDVRQAELEAGQALQQLRSPQAVAQNMEGIPQVVETGSNGIPIVGQGSVLAEEIPVVGSSKKTSRRLKAASRSNSAALTGTTGSGALPRMLPNRPPSTSIAPAMLPRLASLSTLLSSGSGATSGAADASDSVRGGPSGPRMPNPLKRQRTRDSSISSRRSTPDPMPQMRLKSVEDYPVLGTDEISRLPIAYFCRDNRHGRPTKEFVERENNSIRKMYEPLTKNSATESDGQSTQTAATETPPDKKSRNDSGEGAAPTSQLAASSNRMAAQVRIVDGKVVVDSESLVISRSDMAGAGNEQLELVDESARPRFINSLTYVQKRASRKRWTADETEEFYVALRRYGSDFEMISVAMPGRNRYDIRNKFKAEEKKDNKRITATLLAQRSPPLTPLSATKLASMVAEAQSDSGDDAQTTMLEGYSMTALSDGE
ncbi:hypothetical protein IW138_001537 [Coemansia sp. RSA 986]|nr:hypothetical protein IW138_001537 [Coemansia sp. RSA 986]